MAGAVAFAAAAMVLSSTFNWPDVLREPASVVMPAFADGGTSLVWTWFATAWTYAILAVPILLLPAVLGRRDDPALRVATYAGATSVMLSPIGFCAGYSSSRRWPAPMARRCHHPRSGGRRVDRPASVRRRAARRAPGQLLVIGWSVTLCVIIVRTRVLHRWLGVTGLAVSDIWAWATGLRLDTVTADSRLGQRLAGRDQVIGPGPRRLARRHGIRIRPRAASAAGTTVTFADGSAAEFDAVVWATGFTANHSWIDIQQAKDDQGGILHQRGVTPYPGPIRARPHLAAHPRRRAARPVGSDAAFLAAQIGRR